MSILNYTRARVQELRTENPELCCRVNEDWDNLCLRPMAHPGKCGWEDLPRRNPKPTGRKLWRYHFVHPVKGRPYADTPQNYHGMGHVNGSDYITVNVPLGSSEPPVVVPWSNIKYKEEILDY